MRLMCQEEDSQYASKQDFEPFPLVGLEQLMYSPCKENSPGQVIMCLISWDVGCWPEACIFWLPGSKITSKANYYQFLNSGVAFQE